MYSRVFMHPILKSVFIAIPVVFVANVIIIASGLSVWWQPLSWLDWFGSGVRFVGAWCGDHLGYMYNALADSITYVYNHLSPAFTQSLKQLWSASSAGFYAVGDFFKHLWTVLIQYRAVQVIIHPVGLFLMGVILLLLVFYWTSAMWPFAPLWERVGDVLASMADWISNVDTRVRLAATEGSAGLTPVPKPTTKRGKHGSIGVVGRRDED